jgi:hypothetical protein
MSTQPGGVAPNKAPANAHLLASSVGPPRHLRADCVGAYVDLAHPHRLVAKGGAQRGRLDPSRSLARGSRSCHWLVDRRLGPLWKRTLWGALCARGPRDGLRPAEPAEHGLCGGSLRVVTAPRGAFVQPSRGARWASDRRAGALARPRAGKRPVRALVAHGAPSDAATHEIAGGVGSSTAATQSGGVVERRRLRRGARSGMSGMRLSLHSSRGAVRRLTRPT